MSGLINLSLFHLTLDDASCTVLHCFACWKLHTCCSVCLICAFRTCRPPDNWSSQPATADNSWGASAKPSADASWSGTPPTDNGTWDESSKPDGGWDAPATSDQAPADKAAPSSGWGAAAPAEPSGSGGWGSAPAASTSAPSGAAPTPSRPVASGKSFASMLRGAAQAAPPPEVSTYLRLCASTRGMYVPRAQQQGGQSAAQCRCSSSRRLLASVVMQCWCKLTRCLQPQALCAFISAEAEVACMLTLPQHCLLCLAAAQARACLSASPFSRPRTRSPQHHPPAGRHSQQQRPERRRGGQPPRQAGLPGSRVQGTWRLYIFPILRLGGSARAGQCSCDRQPGTGPGHQLAGLGSWHGGGSTCSACAS